jgi:hypothetical protein
LKILSINMKIKVQEGRRQMAGRRSTGGISVHTRLREKGTCPHSVKGKEKICGVW